MNEITKIINAIGAWIQRAFANIKKEVIPIANQVVTVTQALEVRAMEVGPLLEELFPNIAPEVMAAIKVVAPEVIASMQILQGAFQPPAGFTVEESINLMLTRIEGLVGADTKSFAWLEFTAKLNQQVADYLKLGKLTITESINLVHEIYNALHKGPVAEMAAMPQ